MKKPLSKILQYLILCFVLALLFFFLIFFGGNPKIQKIIIILASAWYVLWGYYHHSRERTLELPIIFEYLVYGLLGGALIIGLI